ncbi:MAG: BMC domain-containing protein [Elusimicrobiota bacterium]|nr:BMC domain-containing protein [Elusimicrobiota bacterium]
MEALGLIETRGLVGVIEAADVMVKTAPVTIVDFEKTGDGIVTVKIRGPVADCRAAVDAAAAAVTKVSELLSAHVIPLPFPELEENLNI